MCVYSYSNIGALIWQYDSYRYPAHLWYTTGQNVPNSLYRSMVIYDLCTANIPWCMVGEGLGIGILPVTSYLSFYFRSVKEILI